MFKLVLNLFLPSFELVVIVVLEAHVVHITDGLVHRVQCFLVVSLCFFLYEFSPW